MFNQLQYRLLKSYLGVMILVLMFFAIAVRIAFTQSLHAQFEDKLEILAQAAAIELEADPDEDEDEELEELQEEVDTEVLVSGTQSIQWFDGQGQLLATQGEAVLSSALEITEPFQGPTFQVQKQPDARKGLTLPVPAPDGEPFGYVRVSDSLAELQSNLKRLDWGLGIAMLFSLGFSALGGRWLTRQALVPIEDSFQRLQQFTGDASHELRSPLTAIKTNASVALKYADGMRPTDLEKFQAIANAATQMTDLTEDLLALARLDQNTAPTELTEIDLQSLLQRQTASYHEQTQKKSIDLGLECASPLIIRGNENQLIRLFSNLLDNAIRYTPTSGRINIQALAQTSKQALQQKQLLRQRTSKQLPMATIHIQDSGTGLSTEQMAHVFDRFWQAETARSYQVKGFGLGLSIAQKIVHCHGGTLSVTSQEGQGSQFTVTLPLV